MSASTAASATIHISAGYPMAQTVFGYNSLTYVEIGGVESIGTIGGNASKVEFQPLKGPKQKRKGPTDHGSLQPAILYDASDAGQALVRSAAQPANTMLHAIKVMLQTGEVRFFQARVFGWPETVGNADTMVMAAPTIEINTAVVKYNAAAPPKAESAPIITGTPEVGQPFAYLRGQYTGDVTSYSYRLLRNGVAVAGFDPATYVWASADVGATMTLEETASNQYGPATGVQVSAGVVVPVPLLVPLTAEGVAGNRVCYPSVTYGKGPNAHLMAVNLVLMDGRHVVRFYRIATNRLVEEKIVRSDRPIPDDHNMPGGDWLADGSYVCGSTDHSLINNIVIATRSPTGAWSSETLTYTDVITYPNLLIDKYNKLWLFIRRNNEQWQVRTKTGAGAWTAPESFQIMAEQTYASPIFYVEASHKFLMFPRPNGQSANAGLLKIVQLDAATGEFSDGNGGLGFIGGAASNNGKALPYNTTDVFTFHTPSAPSQRFITDVSADGQALLVTTRRTDDDNYIAQQVWKFGGTGSIFAQANYVLSPIIDTEGAQISAQSNYRPGAAFMPAPTGYRIVITRKEGADTVTYQYDNASGDMVDWSKKELVNTRVSGSILWRPTAALRGTPTAPLELSWMDSFTDFNVFTNSRIRWATPWNGVRELRPETKAALATLQQQPTEPWANFYDRIVTRMVMRGLLAKSNVLAPIVGYNAQSKLLNFADPTKPLLLAGGLPASALEAGRVGVVGDGIGYLETGFDPTVTTGKYSRTSALLSAKSHKSAQDAAPLVGTSYALTVARSATDGIITRINQAASEPQVATTDGAGRFTQSRELEAVVRRFKDAVNLGSTTTATSAPIAGETFRLLTRFGSTARFAGTASGLVIGSGVTTTEVSFLHTILDQAEVEVAAIP